MQKTKAFTHNELLDLLGSNTNSLGFPSHAHKACVCTSHTRPLSAPHLRCDRQHASVHLVNELLALSRPKARDLHARPRCQPLALLLGVILWGHMSEKCGGKG